MSIGFSYKEELSGTYHWLDDPLVEKHAQMRLRVVGTSVPDAFRERRLAVRGELDLEGLVSGAELRGTVGLKIRERRIPYDVEFYAGGRMLRLLGEKDLHPALLEDTIALLPLSIFDEKGYELGRARLRMPLLGAGVRALASFRLRWFGRATEPFDEARGSSVR
ncbi:MAG: hypothetical protein U0174_28740 [Polyangiaceae bacterium]